MATLNLSAVYVDKLCRWCNVKVTATKEELPACWDCQDLYEKLEGNKDLALSMIKEIESKTTGE